MLDQIKSHLLFALCASIGGTLGCIIMRVYQAPIELLRFFVVEFIVCFVVHILLTLLSEKLKSKKQ